MTTIKLTVIFRNDGPLVCCNDSPSYRSKQIELTVEQLRQLEPQPTYSSGGVQHFEAISKCFLEKIR